MEINNSPVYAIYNPAAVVNSTGRSVGTNNPEEVFQESGNRTISLESRIRAANGDGRLSAESAEAIANGALPPEVVVDTDPSITEAVQQTSDLQRSPQQVDDAYLVDLSEAARNLNPSLNQASVQQEQAAAQARIATISAAANVFSGGGGGGADTATAALGNTVNVQV